MPANVSTPVRPLSPAPPDRTRRIVYDVMNAVVLVLSVLLIIVISIDTFKKVPLLESHRYMTFQFWVCVVFILDFLSDLYCRDASGDSCVGEFCFCSCQSLI